MTKQQAKKLWKLIRAYGDGLVAQSWQGQYPPEEWDEIDKVAAKAYNELFNFIEELKDAVPPDSGKQSK
jgi:hypothetical protein